MLVGYMLLRTGAALLMTTAVLWGADAPKGPGLPAWLKLGAEIRGRVESNTAIGFVRDRDAGYYLHRLRLSAGVEPHRQVRFFVQVQDSQAPGYGLKPVLATVVNTLDLRQGYLELGLAGQNGWSLRLGRQDLIFGEERLVGASGWGNVGRSFDAARFSYKRQRVRLDWFASAVVVPLKDSFDHPRLSNGFYGFYSSFDRLIQYSVVEPYLLWKTASRVRGEVGVSGDQDLYTSGVCAVGKLRRGFDYGLEVALQTGHYARDDIRAWAGHWALGYALPAGKRPPRLLLEYNYASGDGDPADGRRGTFDQLYPTNHFKYGTADRMGWRNVHDLMAGLEWRFFPKWRVNPAWHRFSLANRRDGLYTEAGAPLLRYPGASSSRVGDEIDLEVTHQFSPRFGIGAGYAHLFRGPYLEHAGRSGASYPYLMWTCRL